MVEGIGRIHEKAKTEWLASLAPVFCTECKYGVSDTRFVLNPSSTIPAFVKWLDDAREIQAKDGQSVEIPAKEKMDKGQRETARVIRKASCKELCPCPSTSC